MIFSLAKLEIIFRFVYLLFITIKLFVGYFSLIKCSIVVIDWFVVGIFIIAILLISVFVEVVIIIPWLFSVMSRDWPSQWINIGFSLSLM